MLLDTQRREITQKERSKNLNNSDAENSRLLPASKFQFDVYISHANEDKSTIVTPLVDMMKKHGVRYWLDEEQIAWGQSLTKRINLGIVSSRFMLAIVSHNYIAKPWSRIELEAAIHKQIQSDETIVLPVFVGDQSSVTRILLNLPLIRGYRYVKWKGNPEQLVLQLIERMVIDH
jgi:hypothetical protein